MNKAAASPTFSYLEILAIIGAVALAVILYFLFRRILRLRPAAKESIFNHFLVRVSLPAACLVTVFCLKIKPIHDALSLSAKFDSVLNAAVLFFFGFFVIRLLDVSILSWYKQRHIPFPLPRVLHGFILILIYLAILFAILKGILEINITPFLATSAILTMILGLALQGVLGNVLAGMSLNFTKSFSRGDWVEIGPHEGVVIDTNWRETLLFDRASNIIVIPNNMVASEMITNFSRPDKKTALTIPLKVSSQAPSAAVLDILREAAKEVPDVLTSPAPEAYILSYDELGISYLLKFWVTDYSHKHPITGEVGRLIWYKFKRQGIDVPVAMGEKVQDVLGAIQEKKAILAAEDEKERTYEDLLGSSFLRYQEGEKAGELIVSEDEVRELSASVRREKFSRGEILFRQGEKGENCYIVAKGLVRGEIIYEDHGKRYTSEFKVGPGGIFGEMSLFTGMPRTATGIIEAESELLQINAENFADLLAENPKLAEVIADIVSSRNQKNQEFLRKIKELSEKDVEESCNKKSILARLLSFVRLRKRKG